MSTYELGHQPFGLASPAAWLENAGIQTRCFDLSLEQIDKNAIRSADLVGFYLPMHTATRIAVPVISAVREMNSNAHLCAFGLYAPMNAQFLHRLGVNSVIGGEYESELVKTALESPGSRAVDEHDFNSPKEIHIGKQQFLRPSRQGLPALDQYAYLTMPDGSKRTVGYTEASRGCKHLCRHCPIVPVYNGRFVIVQKDVVIADIRQQIEAGAEHFTFGDPDFFNGTGHAIKIVHKFHELWPDLTYDVTVKVEHLVKFEKYLPVLKETGCLFVISAVESVDNAILENLDKGHTREDFYDAVALCRKHELGLNPTFVAFTPWITLEGYRDLLRTLAELDLVESVTPVQLAIRLLIPNKSRVLELESIQKVIEPFDDENLCYPWQHPDPRVDKLQVFIEEIVEKACAEDTPRLKVFEKIWEATQHAIGNSDPVILDLSQQSENSLPILSEPWYCCAEPTKQQLESFM
ncbi:MAG: radical SAM protein [Sulfitobacter sp.]|nr:MAG: radical SAM protein [Sulfitobacter sp.]